MNGDQIAAIVNEHGISLETAYSNKLIDVSKKTARARLNADGWAYDKTTKQWIKGDAPAAPQHTQSTQPSQRKKTAAPTFTLEQFAVLQQFADNIINGNIDITALQESTYITANSNTDITPVTQEHKGSAIELYERTRHINKVTRGRKTYVLSNTVAQQFNDLAERVNLDKSDLLELALSDFITKYSE